jgi:hypothetical protein
LAKRLNAKIYSEAKRLGVNGFLEENAATCEGHSPIYGYLQWTCRFLEEPVSPITGTHFDNAKSTKRSISVNLQQT